MPLIAICGESGSYNMGNGKTAVMTLLTFMDAANGRSIRANYRLKGIEFEYMETLNQCIIKMREGDGVTVDEDGELAGDTNSTYAIDELTSWFNCYQRPNANNDGFELWNLAKQTRKLDIKMYYSSQTYSKIPKFLRELTQKIYLVSKCHYVNGVFVKCEKDDCYSQHYIAIRECVMEGEYLIQPKPTRFFLLPLDIFKMYNTKELIKTTYVAKPKKTSRDY